jgi:hypothetical protein
MTHPHVGEPRKATDHIVDKFWRKRLAKSLELLRLDTSTELLHGSSRIDDLELAKEQNHSIDQRRLALEAVSSLFVDLIEKLIKRSAKDENLKNRVHVTHVARVDQATGLYESHLFRGGDLVRAQSLGNAMGWALARHGVVQAGRSISSNNTVGGARSFIGREA